VHLAIESKFAEIRYSVNTYLVQATARAPQLANRLIGDALTSFLSRGRPSLKTTSILADDQVQPRNKQSRLSTLLLSVVSFGDDVDLSFRENAVVEHILLAHHCLLCSPFYSAARLFVSFFFAGGPDRQTWIDLCQKASLDPYELINKYLDKLFNLVLDGAYAESKVCW
jgi:Generalcontrol nonderepressible 1 (Gcn1) N-terminal